MNDEKNLALVQQEAQPQERGISIFSSKEAFELGQRMAQVFATSALVPKQYQNNIGNCMIALNMAHRMNSDPLMVMQNLVLVHNVPTFEAKFAIACFNATGKYSPIRYKMTGEKGKDTWGCIAYAIEKATGDICEGMEITIAMAKAEGWYNQNPKWKNIPELMLRYRAASWFIRTTDPGVMMGFQTREEAEDVYDDYEELPTNTPVSTAANAEEFVVTESAQNEPSKEDATATVAPESATAEPAKKEEEKVPLGKQKTPDIFNDGQ